MRRRTFFGTDIFICPQNVFYYIKYNPEPFSEGEPKEEFLHSGQIKRVYFGNTKVRDTAIIPQYITRDKLLFEKFEISTLDNIKVSLTGLTFDIAFISPNKIDPNTQKTVLDKNILDSIIKYRHFFDYIPITKGVIKDNEIKEELINAMRNGIEEALKELSFLELWTPVTNKVTITKKIDSKFQNFPFRIVSDTLSNFSIDKLLNLRPGIIQEITYQKESNNEFFVTNENIKLQNFKVAFKVEVEEFDVQKYTKLFQSLDIARNEQISDWVVKNINLEKILKSLTYSNLVGSDKGEGSIKNQINAALESYPISLIENSINIYFDGDKIPIAENIYNSNVSESEFVNCEEAVFNNIKINFSFSLDTSDKPKLRTLFSNLLNSNDIVQWVQDYFKNQLILKTSTLTVEDLKEGKRFQEIKDYINELLKPFALFIPEAEKVNIMVEDPPEINDYVSGNIKGDPPIKFRPIVIYQTKKAKKDFHTLNTTQDSKNLEAAKYRVSQDIKVKKLLEEKELLDQKNSKQAALILLKKENIKFRLEEFLLFDNAKDEFIKAISNNKLTSKISDFDLLQLEQTLNENQIQVDGFQNKLIEANKSAELKMEELQKEHEAIIKEKDIRINELQDKYDFNKNERWEFLLKQSAIKDGQNVGLLGDIFKFLFLLQYTKKENQDKKEMLESVTELLKNDNLNPQNAIRIINSKDFDTKSINELIKNFSVTNHFSEILNEIFSSNEKATNDNFNPGSTEDSENEEGNENTELL